MRNYMSSVFPLNQRLETASPHDEEFDCTVAEVNKDKNRVNKHLPGIYTSPPNPFL